MTSGAIIAPIVEGHGEVRALPTLLRRIAGELFSVWDIAVAKPFRVDSGKMLKTDELVRAVRVQATRVTGRGGVLILRDGDDFPCPVTLAEQLAGQVFPVSVPVHVVIANPEYEAWFLAALESLTRHSEVRSDAVGPTDPEAKRDAKGALELCMIGSYRETLHQEKFTAEFDLQTARARSRSFRRLVDVVEKLTQPGE